MFKNKKLFVLDMDGTFYLGNKLLPGSLEFARKIESMGHKLVFLTNNSSATPQQYVTRLNGLGVQSRLFSVYTSGEATMSFLKGSYPEKKVYLLATPEVEKMFQDSGIDLTSENPDVAVLTFDKTIDYEKLTRFSEYVRNGLPYIVSHPDINCPTENGPIPDVGSFMALIEASTGRKPDYVVGKPNRLILEMLIKDAGFSKEETIIVGDRLYTDIECGLRAGVDSVLVLSGETTIDMVPDEHDYKVLKDLSILCEAIYG